jgi:ERCC4-type nuclease
VIHVDTREKPPTFVRKLELMLPAGDFSRHTLKAGDYALFDQDGHSLGIEHKRPLDWLASLGDVQANGEKRIWNEIAKMEEWYSHPTIVVSGPLQYDLLTQTLGSSRHSTGWKSNAARLLELAIARRTPILHLASEEEMLDLLVYLNRRAKSGCVIPGLGIIEGNHDRTSTLPRVG